MFLSVEGPGKHIIIGNTLDDALGEAYDKTARLLGLGYPGGAELEKLAKTGNEKRFKFPRPLTGKKGCNFSFILAATHFSPIWLWIEYAKSIEVACLGNSNISPWGLKIYIFSWKTHIS